MFLVSHPTGNANVRALLEGLESRHQLALFTTTLALSATARLPSWLPAQLRAQLERRRYALQPKHLMRRPWPEIARLAAFGRGKAQERVDGVYRDLDQWVAAHLENWKSKHCLSGVYGYEDGCAKTFERAEALGLNRLYELPIAYFETAQQIIQEERLRRPEWAATLPGLTEPDWKLDRKRAELERASVVICPSRFVRDSLPAPIRDQKRVVVATYGGPAPVLSTKREPRSIVNRPMRVLFAGSLSQRKGLGYLFDAMRILDSNEFELVMLGALVQPLEFYHQFGVSFVHQGPRSHSAMLDVMRTCDVLVLPSLLEGRALVVQEAMSCGLPVIVTPNSGTEDLVEDGSAGFLVPIRSAKSIATALARLMTEPGLLAQMSAAAWDKARECGWRRFQETVISTIASVEGPMPAGDKVQTVKSH